MSSYKSAPHVVLEFTVDNIPRIIVVDASSASPALPGITYYGIEATHSQMCKFDSPSAPGFRAVSTDIRAWAIEAPVMIANRWSVEDEARAVQLQVDINERLSPYLNPRPRRSASPQHPTIPLVPGYTMGHASTYVQPQWHGVPLYQTEMPVHVRQRGLQAPNKFSTGWEHNLRELEGE